MSAGVSWPGALRSVLESPLWRGAAVQARVVHALALRETRTRFGGHKLGYVWALLEPLFWIGTFWGFFALLGRNAPGNADVVPFLATGIIPYDLVMKTADRGAQAVSGNKALLFYPQVQPLDLVIARSFLEVATGLVVFALIVGGHAMVVQHIDLDDLLTTMFGLLLAGTLGGAFGLVLCAAMVRFPTLDRVRGPLLRPLFWTSGLFFTAESMPSQIRDVLLWNPILHCVELVRAGWFASYDARHASPAYVCGWIVALAFVGLTLERTVRHKVELS